MEKTLYPFEDWCQEHDILVEWSYMRGQWKLTKKVGERDGKYWYNQGVVPPSIAYYGVWDEKEFNYGTEQYVTTHYEMTREEVEQRLQELDAAFSRMKDVS